MTGNSLIGNTSQFMVDATGKRVVLDLEHCVCCDQTVEGTCGECADQVSSVVVDLGTTTWTGENDVGSSGYVCDTPCTDLTGELALSPNAYYMFLGEYESPCEWYIAYDPFCYFSIDDPFVVLMHVGIRYSGGSWIWQAKMDAYLWADVAFGTGIFRYWLIRSVVYETSTTTTCLGGFTLSKTIDSYFQIPSWEVLAGYTPQPCYTAKPLWAWPATIDLTTA